MLGLYSENYTITCEVLPRVPNLPSPSADALRTATAVALADSFLPPVAMQPPSRGALGEDTALKIAAICAGALSFTSPWLCRCMHQPHHVRTTAQRICQHWMPAISERCSCLQQPL